MTAPMNHLVITLLLLSALTGVAVADYSTCNGCFCVPDPGDSCPTDVPPVNLTESWLSNLQGMTLIKPMNITCNPFDGSSCKTEPPLETGGVCVAEIIAPSDTTQKCPTGYSYRLTTMASAVEIDSDSQFVTHLGACGVCSTFKDLVASLLNDASSLGLACGLRATLDFDDGLKCVKDFGYTEPCAKLWIYNSVSTRAECFSCVLHALTKEPNNLDPPACYPAECIQCTQDKIAPVFNEFAGRNRTNSGFLSPVIQNCSVVPHLVQQDPCQIASLMVQEELSPTQAPINTTAPTADHASNDTYVITPDEIATCNGCWCLPDSGDLCPSDVPQIYFPDAWLSSLKSMSLQNPRKLSCNPFEDSTCQTIPAVEEGGACVAKIIPPSNLTDECPTGYSYRLMTVASEGDVENDSQIVTHLGACGVCSTFQDLAAYMTEPLSSVGTDCAMRILANFTDGLACVMKFGFTEPCARINIYDALNTNENCPSCLMHALLHQKNNLDPPSCGLAQCTQCHEDVSAAIYNTFAGRTRANSRLLSATVWNCSSYSHILPQDPCELY